ncbi:MAG: surface antigen [Pseudobdellovibrio sp.]|jgi:outer membrane protein assembly complex protein YaeT|nr:surface antigen [Pseudobdellovibrio sp.]
MIRWLMFLLFFLQITGVSAAQLYSVSLKDWPSDIVAKINRIAPEINRKNLDPATLNEILKKLDESFNFFALKLVQTEGSNELILVGEISPEVKVRFENLSDLSESEAVSTMGLNVASLMDEENLKSGVEKLAAYYRELGFRSAEVRYKVVSESTLIKTIVFTVNKKERTRLKAIILEGIDNPQLLRTISQSLKRKHRNDNLTQETLGKIAVELRRHLSVNGYYYAQVPSPQIQFAADELSAKVVYKLQLNQRYYIEIKNTRNFTHDYLEEEILKLNTLYTKDGNLGSELSEKLKNFYVTEGYPHVTVLFYETKIKDRIHLYLNVDEGPLTKISEFKVVGQYSRSETFYKDKFLELSSVKVQDEIFIKEEIEAAAKNLLIYLQNDGYVNAKLSRVFTSTDREEPKNGIVILQLEEGEQLRVAEVNFNGVNPANADAVRNAVGITPGQSLSLVQLEAALLNLKTYYQTEGYLEYKLDNENDGLTTYSDNNSLVRLSFDIHEGPKVVAQSIEIEGNTRTKDKLIFLELDFKPGDTLNPAKLEESVQRLQRTGYFNSVEISTLEKDTDIANRTVVVKVVERDPGLRVIGAGVTDENGGTLHGYFGIAYRNFWGRGVGASFRSEANYNFATIKFLEHKHTLGIVWPYIFETRARFRISATRSTTIADVRINKVTEANSAIFSLEQDFTSHLTGIFSYSVSTFFDHGIDPEDEIKYGYNSESLVIGAVGPALELDNRDNIFNPGKGNFSRVAFEYAADGIGNNNVDDFYRVTAETTHYFPLNKSGLVFAQSVRGGYLEDLDDGREGVPFDKRGFSLGGRTTIRGFESGELFPSTQDIGASYRLTTSSNFKLIKSEIRFPLSYKYDLSGGLFYDGGQVEIEGLTLTDKWRDAVGFGIRYNTPVGPLNLEYAQKLDKKASESDGAFHLSVGVF